MKNEWVQGKELAIGKLPYITQRRVCSEKIKMLHGSVICADVA